MSEKKYGGIIQNWYLSGGMILGNLYNDPQERFMEGAFIHTSQVVGIIDTELETLNTIYTLGEPYVYQPSQASSESQSKSCI